MFVNRIPTTLLLDQLSADTYDPVLIKTVAKVSDGERLGDFLLTGPKLGVTGTIAESYVSGDVPGAVPYLTTKQVNGLFAHAEDCKYITAEADELWAKCRVKDGAILINKSGDVGAAALLSAPNFRHVNTVSDLINIAVKGGPDGFDPAYLVVYLNSPYAQDQLRRLSGGAIFSHVSIFAIPQVRTYRPSFHVQEYIGDMVRQAERLRALGNRNLSNARRAIELVNDGQLAATELGEEQISMVTAIERNAHPNGQADPKHDRVHPKLLGDRIDSWFYKPEFVRGDNQLQRIREAGIDTPSMESFADVSYGFMPTEDYWSPSEGAVFLRVTNIQDNLRLDLSKLEYVNPILSKAARYRLKQNDIICVQCGNSTGRIALISSRCNDWVFPSFALRIRLKDDEWDAAYVAGYLASWLGQSQIQRSISITSVRPNTTKPAIEAVTVPKLPLRTQQLLGSQLRRAINCVEQSVPLCYAAKVLVEALVERKVSEDQIISSKINLERGDTSAERSILSRLFAGGWDATETQPLFPDFDVYYETIRIVQREQVEIAAK